MSDEPKDTNLTPGEGGAPKRSFSLKAAVESGTAVPKKPVDVKDLKLVEPMFEHATERSWTNAWNNFKGDVESRFMKNLDPHAKPVVHADHTHPADHTMLAVDKIAVVGGSAVGLGVALHGLYNVKRGVAGWQDKELDETHKPSLQYTVVGAAETVGGLALMKRLLTGTLKIF